MKTNTALEITKIAINPTGYLIGKIVETTLKTVTKGVNIDTTETPQLIIETEKQELQIRLAEAQARVAQEIAIAKRIETAEEVEMEEYYDYSGEGHIGVNATERSLTLGAGGSGRRVSKRIYRFRGRKT